MTGVLAISGWLTLARASEAAFEGSFFQGSNSIRDTKSAGGAENSASRRLRGGGGGRGGGEGGGGAGGTATGIGDDTPRLLDGAMSGLHVAAAAAAAATVEGVLDT